MLLIPLYVKKYYLFVGIPTGLYKLHYGQALEGLVIAGIWTRRLVGVI
jgi:hypothetical protein